MTSTSRWIAALVVGLLGIGSVTAPGTATTVSGSIPGGTLVVQVKGVSGPATVRITGPNGFTRKVQVNGRERLRGLQPGRYALTAFKAGKAKATDRMQTVRVRKASGPKVRFTYRVPAPDVTAPPSASNLRVVNVTSTSVRLAWNNPADGEFLQVQVRRSGGTDAATGELVLDQDGRGLVETGLSPNTEYTYFVATEDEAGNLSPEVSITVRTLG
jgi:Fibronectin type III domain